MRCPLEATLLPLLLFLGTAPVASALRGLQQPGSSGRGLQRQRWKKPAWRSRAPSDAELDVKPKPPPSSTGVMMALGAAAPPAATQHSGNLAVVISGLRSRLVLNSTLERVVQPAVRIGYNVSLFLSLVGASGVSSFSAHGLSDPNLAEKSPEELQQWTELAVRAAGGHLAHFAYRAEPEAVDALPTDELHRSFMYDYPPGGGSAVGLNVLRRWRSSEELLNETLRAGQPAFDFVLWEREDQFWLRPLWLFNFPSAAESVRSVFAKNCLGWGGLNDKSLLLGREAAQELLGAYTSFWLQEPSLRSRNAEQYLERLAVLRGLQVRRLPFQVLPSTDATYTSAKTHTHAPGRDAVPELCVRSFYSCKSELPPGSPPFCPDDKAKEK